MTCGEGKDPTDIQMMRLLESVNLELDDVLFTNAVLCLPASKDGKYPATARLQKQCRPWLERLILDIEAQAIITFGGIALSAVGRVKSHGLTLKSGAGILADWFGRKLLPLYHPSRLGRVNRPEKMQFDDIKAIESLLGN
jgi:uracil-DNA glycosylase family 4